MPGRPVVWGVKESSLRTLNSPRTLDTERVKKESGPESLDLHLKKHNRTSDHHKRRFVSKSFNYNKIRYSENEIIGRIRLRNILFRPKELGPRHL